MKKITFLSSFILKIVALVTMAFDHFGLMLEMSYPYSVDILKVAGTFRIIGRLALPLFVFMIVEGVLHTKNFKKYILRLGIMALLVSIFFMVLEYSSFRVYAHGLLRAGNIFLGDMLTDIERLNFLMKSLYDEYKNLVTVDKIEIKLTKDSQPIPLSDNVEKLFTNDAYSIIYEGHEITLWWANIIEDRGLFLVVIDEDYEDEDEDDDEDVKKLLPAPKYTNPYYDYWDDVYGYDSYDYDDRYYQRT